MHVAIKCLSTNVCIQLEYSAVYIYIGEYHTTTILTSTFLHGQIVAPTKLLESLPRGTPANANGSQQVE